MSARSSQSGVFTVHRLHEYLLHDLEIFKLIFVACFVVLGGYIFAGKETTNYDYSRTQIDLHEFYLVEELETLAGGMSNKASIENMIRKRVITLVKNYEILPEDDDKVVWTLAIAMYYSFVMITTIGYGDFMPVTHWGKVWTIFYAGAGIAMCLSIFIKFGNALVMIMYNLYTLMKLCFIHRFRKTIKNHHLPTMTKCLKDVSIIFVFLLNVVFIVFGTALLKSNNNLSFIDLSYFLVITVSTIGFGDIYPDRRNKIMCVILTIFGLGLMAALFTKIRKLMQHKIEFRLIKFITQKTRNMKARLPINIKHIGRLKRQDDQNRQSILTHRSIKSKTPETMSSWSDYGEQAYVVDFERCLVM